MHEKNSPVHQRGSASVPQEAFHDNREIPATEPFDTLLGSNSEQTSSKSRTSKTKSRNSDNNSANGRGRSEYKTSETSFTPNRSKATYSNRNRRTASRSPTRPVLSAGSEPTHRKTVARTISANRQKLPVLPVLPTPIGSVQHKAIVQRDHVESALYASSENASSKSQTNDIDRNRYINDSPSSSEKSSSLDSFFEESSCERQWSGNFNSGSVVDRSYASLSIKSGESINSASKRHIKSPIASEKNDKLNAVHFQRALRDNQPAVLTDTFDIKQPAWGSDIVWTENPNFPVVSHAATDKNNNSDSELVKTFSRKIDTIMDELDTLKAKYKIDPNESSKNNETITSVSSVLRLPSLEANTDAKMYAKVRSASMGYTGGKIEIERLGTVSNDVTPMSSHQVESPRNNDMDSSSHYQKKQFNATAEMLEKSRATSNSKQQRRFALSLGFGRTKQTKNDPVAGRPAMRHYEHGRSRRRLPIK
jgi:hypothetical protein